MVSWKFDAGNKISMLRLWVHIMDTVYTMDRRYFLLITVHWVQIYQDLKR